MGKTFNACKQLVRRGYSKAAGVGTGLALTVGQAKAAIPAEAQTALDSMKTDAMAVATVFLVATIAIAAFMYMRKPAK